MIQNNLSSLALPSRLALDEGPGGLPRATVTHPLASGELYLHGAHASRWQPAGERPVLWMSERSDFAPGKPIRGGVPICFPWFGAKADDPAAPGHGLARLRAWTLEETAADDESVTLTLALTLDPFALRYRVRFGRELSLSLSVRNAGAAAASFEAALHTYFAVSDIHRVRVLGLEGADYLDQLADRRRVPATGRPIEFTGETDRIYLDEGGAVTIEDAGWDRRIRVGKRGSGSTVVWNPWTAKAARMPDFGDEEWPGMLCIETANVGDRAVTLEPGQAHEMEASIRVNSGVRPS